MTRCGDDATNQISHNRIIALTPQYEWISDSLMSSIAFQTIEGRVAFVKEINFSQSLKLFLVLLRMYKKKINFWHSEPCIFYIIIYFKNQKSLIFYQGLPDMMAFLDAVLIYIRFPYKASRDSRICYIFAAAWKTVKQDPLSKASVGARLRASTHLYWDTLFLGMLRMHLPLRVLKYLQKYCCSFFTSAYGM